MEIQSIKCHPKLSPLAIAEIMAHVGLVTMNGSESNTNTGGTLKYRGIGEAKLTPLEVTRPTLIFASAQDSYDADGVGWWYEANTKTLHLDRVMIVEVQCPRLMRWVEKIPTTEIAVVVVYPDGTVLEYLNTPDLGKHLRDLREVLNEEWRAANCGG